MAAFLSLPDELILKIFSYICRPYSITFDITKDEPHRLGYQSESGVSEMDTEAKIANIHLWSVFFINKRLYAIASEAAGIHAFDGMLRIQGYSSVKGYSEDCSEASWTLLIRMYGSKVKTVQTIGYVPQLYQRYLDQLPYLQLVSVWASSGIPLAGLAVQR